MTREEWIDECKAHGMISAPCPANESVIGAAYDRLCRLIDSRIEAAMKRQAGAVAASPPRPVVELREGQVWTKDRCFEDDVCVVIYFYDGGSCRSFYEDASESRAFATRLQFEEDIPIDRVAHILRRFGFDVRGPAASPAPSTPGPERYGCKIVHVSSTEGGPWNVVAPNGTAWLSETFGWMDDGAVQTERSMGIFTTESDARAALAKALPPPGYTAPSFPDDATLRAAGWVRADAILALLGKDKP